eukprot:scaffold10574_cov54-Phaeocystis_antarctica.AAC.1
MALAASEAERSPTTRAMAAAVAASLAGAAEEGGQSERRRRADAAAEEEEERQLGMALAESARIATNLEAKAAAEKAAAEWEQRGLAQRALAEKRAAANLAAVKRLTDLLSYAPGSASVHELRTAILAAREAQVMGALVTKAEELLQRAEQAAVQEKLAAEEAAAEKAAAEKAAAAKAAAATAVTEAKAAVKRAAVETLDDLLGYAPESVDCLKLQVAILAAREAQVVGTLLKKAERLLETAEQVAAQVASPLAPHGSGGGGGTPLRKGEQVYYLQSDGSRLPGTVITVHTDEASASPPYLTAEGY